jgi:hypothetical protein
VIYWGKRACFWGHGRPWLSVYLIFFIIVPSVAAVKDSFKKMLENGVYKADLFSDL